MSRLSSYNFGIIAEYFALCWYFFHLCITLKHRFKTKFGEIDLICQRFNTIIFVEVKFRSQDYDEILCSAKQQHRMIRSAEFFLLKHPCYRSHQLRFDLILIRPYRLPLRIKNFINIGQ